MRNSARRIDRLIRDLYLNEDVRRAFRDDPKSTGARYGVSERVVELIRSDDQSGLVAAGMDARLIADPAYRLVDRLRLGMSRLAAAAASVVLALTVLVPSLEAQPQKDANSPRIRVRARGLRVGARRLGARAIRFAKGGRASRRAARVLRVRARALRARFARINKSHEVGKSEDLPDGDAITVVDPIE